MTSIAEGAAVMRLVGISARMSVTLGFLQASVEQAEDSIQRRDALSDCKRMGELISDLNEIVTGQRVWPPSAVETMQEAALCGAADPKAKKSSDDIEQWGNGTPSTPEGWTLSGPSRATGTGRAARVCLLRSGR